MTDKKKRPPQRTPKGYEIPVPKRREVMRDFGKIVAPLRDPGPKK
jgi:hypothetical protein